MCTSTVVVNVLVTEVVSGIAERRMLRVFVGKHLLSAKRSVYCEAEDRARSGDLECAYRSRQLPRE